MLSGSITHTFNTALVRKSAENTIPKNDGTTVVGIALLIDAGMMQLMPFGGIEDPAKHSRRQGQIAVVDMPGG